MRSLGLQAKKVFVFCCMGLALWYPCYWLLSMESDVTVTVVEPGLSQTSPDIVKSLEFKDASPTPQNRSQTQSPTEFDGLKGPATTQAVPGPPEESRGRPYSSALDRQYYNTVVAMKEEGLWDEYVRYLSSSLLQPQVNVLLASWRTGSTFIGKMLAAHPGTFYHYEPMNSIGLHQARDGDLFDQAAARLQQLAHCNVSEEFITTSRKLQFGLQNSAPFSAVCAGNKAATIRRNATHWCWDQKFIKNVCQIYPYQLVKTVRVRLNALRLLLEDSPNARVVVLGRDPRATKHSRRKPLFCRRREPLCDDPGLCSDLVLDYHTAVGFEALFPGKVRLLRYEDLVEEPTAQFQALTNFYNLKFTETIKERIKKNMNGTATVPKKAAVVQRRPMRSRVQSPPVVVSAHSTVRDSKFEAQQWRFEMPWQDVVEIQDECEEAMRLWGYNNAPSEDQLKTFEPAGAFTSNIKL